MDLKNKIEYLLSCGFSYKDIGRLCECHSTVISKWLNNQVNISKRMEQSIEAHLQSFAQKMSELFGE